MYITSVTLCDAIDRFIPRFSRYLTSSKDDSNDRDGFAKDTSGMSIFEYIIDPNKVVHTKLKLSNCEFYQFSSLSAFNYSLIIDRCSPLARGEISCDETIYRLDNS